MVTETINKTTIQTTITTTTKQNLTTNKITQETTTDARVGEVLQILNALTDEAKVVVLCKMSFDISKVESEAKSKLAFNIFYNKKENCIDFRDLDFSFYEGDVDTSLMRVNGNLFQFNQYAEGKIVQNLQYAVREIYQDEQQALKVVN